MSDYKANRYAALLVFKESMTEREVNEALEKLKPLLAQWPRVEEYDDRYADPVLYFP